MSTPIALMALGLVAAFVLLFLCIYFLTDWCSPRKSSHGDDPEVGLPQPVRNLPHKDEESSLADPVAVQETPTAAIARLKSFQTSIFAYDELEKATNGFSNILGEGGFGPVFKGVLPDGRQVAVKKLKAGSKQGDREFQVEIETIGHIHHRNLVNLIGYCIDLANRLLVYEFVPNNSLKTHLHGNAISVMNWPTRMKIAKGSAKGLKYLHEDCKPRIIHRDIKADNILLGDDFEPKLADFGLAKYFPDAATHVSTDVKGTFGYLAPEYASTRMLTDKSDVYSFGVMLLELITGKLPVDISCYGHTNIAGWAKTRLRQALNNGNYGDLVDPKLQNEYDYLDMTRMIFCAAACVRNTPNHRPRMSQVVRALEGIISPNDLLEGSHTWATETDETPHYSMGSSDYTQRI
ncbi:proline-rich receptor-like protein kinase PERK15 [Ricinus communis]|uniref:proline-rich receptor-like protein kinase PERK15 n=1 Tax=Ricinus communis TaxID=3988 RepID=UPI00201AF9E6|nr:proline-rich receptor-like protein kinase PERK15 [Ricinus communis]